MESLPKACLEDNASKLKEQFSNTFSLPNKNTFILASAAFLTQNISKTQELQLSSCNIKSEGFIILLRSLKNMPELALMDVSSNKIETSTLLDKYSKHIKSSSIKHLNLTNNIIEESLGTDHFFANISKSCIFHLNLSKNEIPFSILKHKFTSINCLKASNSGFTPMHINFITIAFPSLAVLDIGSNKIEEIKFNPLLLNSLSEFRISRNKLTIPVCRHIASILKDSNIELLDISSNFIEDEGLGAVSAAIPYSSVTHLIISHNRVNTLNNDGYHYIEKMLTSTKKLEIFEMADIGMNDTGAFIIMKGMKGNLSVTEIDISENNFGEHGMHSIFEALKLKKYLKRLKCSNTLLTDYIGGKTDKVNPEMINFNYKTGFNASYLLNLVRIPAEKVDLSSNNFKYNDLLFVMSTLADLKNTTHLILSNNHLSDEGVNLLTKTVAKNKLSLAQLDLSGNGLTNEGVIALSRNLSSFKSLRRLKLDSNSIKGEGFAALVVFLEKGIREISVNHNKIDCKGVSVFLKNFFNESRMTVLELNDNKINDFGAEQLLFVTEKSPELSVFLAQNEFSAEWKAKAFHQTAMQTLLDRFHLE